MKALIVILLFSTCIIAQKTYQKKHFEDGVLMEEGWIQNSQKIDYWIFYYPNGNVKKKGHFIEASQSNFWYYFHNNGEIESKGYFKNNRKQNWWLYYDKQGNICHKYQLENGKKNGYHFHYKNDTIFKAEKYKLGIKIKEWADIDSFKKENKLTDLL
ncbi:MAG: hypothetical protein L3J09_00890 [Flavobacteriaceae bacterium]|nr:hypothetical protein [Flavobacteriaceae bacterium]